MPGKSKTGGGLEVKAAYKMKGWPKLFGGKRRPKRKKTLNLVTGKKRHTQKRSNRFLAKLTFWDKTD